MVQGLFGWIYEHFDVLSFGVGVLLTCLGWLIRFLHDKKRYRDLEATIRNLEATIRKEQQRATSAIMQELRRLEHLVHPHGEGLSAKYEKQDGASEKSQQGGKNQGFAAARAR